MICCACGRIIGDVQITKNGETLCRYCYETIIDEVDKAKSLYDKVKIDLEKAGFDTVKGEVVLSLANKDDVAKKMGENCRGYFSPFTNKMSLIRILNELTYVEFLSVVAHEHIHAWLHHNTLIGNTTYFSEGFAQLGSYIVCKQNKSDEMDIYLRKLEENKDLIYGNQFLYMLKLFEKHGLSHLIERAKEGKEF